MRRYKTIGHIYFGILLILAVIFYQERIIYCDTANFIFKIINSGSFDFEASRYGVALSQILPILAVKTGISLKAVLILYSISFVLVYYSFFLLCTYGLKNVGAGLLIVLITSMGIYHAYVHDSTETNQALVFVAVLYAWLFYSWNEKSNIIIVFKYFGSFLLIVLCYITHPVTIFPVIFVLGYYMIDKQEWKNYYLYLLALIALFIYMLKFFDIKENSYEGTQIAGLKNAFNVLSNIFHIYSLKFFLYRIKSTYFFTVLVAIIAGINYLIKKKYFKLFYFVSATAIFFFIIVINFYQGDSDMMMEKNYLPLIIFIGIPFINDFLSETEWSRLKTVLLVLILFSGFGLMTKSGLHYRHRIQYLNELLSSTKNLSGKKFIINCQDLDANKIEVNWALSIETLLYSSLSGPANSRTIFTENSPSFLQENFETDQFLYTSFWPVLDLNSINMRYFSVEKGNYTVIHESTNTPNTLENN